MPKNLNIVFRYSKIKPIKYRKPDVLKLAGNPIKASSDWNEKKFDSIKRLVRFVHYKSQKRRCAYCRRLLNPLGINEHIDHIVARDVYNKWMFKPRNLVLSCYQCNTQKTNANTLTTAFVPKRLPIKKVNYKFFNPYIHNWHEHFEIEDNLFIRAKTIQAEQTISTYKLFDFKYSIVYSQEANTFGASAIRRATRMMTKFRPDTDEYKNA